MVKTRLSSKVFFSFIILGISLAIFNFLNNRSLWLDEASLALNIANKSTLELLQPLDYYQVAPIGFLLMEKAFASLGGNTDWSMRIFPLLSFLLSIPIFYSISFRLKKEKNFALFSTALYSLSFYPMYFSSEVKQYISDVLFCLAISLTTLLFLERKNEHYSLLLGVGVLSIWFSNAAIIPLFGASLLLLQQTFKQRQDYLKTTLLLSSWLLSFCCYYYFFIHNHPTRDYMIAYWENAGTFLPRNILSRTFFVRLLERIGAFFQLIGAGKLSLLTIPVYCLGLLFLLKTKKKFAYLFTIPIVIHLFLSYFKLYPFSLRLSLYAYPLALITITYAINLVSGRLLSKRTQAFLLTSILLCSVLLLVRRGLPTEREEIKKSLTYLNDRISATDQLYVYYTSVRPLLFYQNDFPAITALNKERIILGESHREEWSRYEDDIKKIDQAVWLLFSHVYHRKDSPGGTDEEEYITNVFENNGFEIIDHKVFKGSSVYRAIPRIND